MSRDIGWREHTFQFGEMEVSHRWLGSDCELVRWHRWPVVEGYSQILLYELLPLFMRNLNHRGCKWSLRVYYVNAVDYQFEKEVTLTKGQQYMLTVNNRPTSINERDMAQIRNWSNHPADGFYVDVIGLTATNSPRIIIQARENNNYPTGANW